jgi:hypothetical protein
MLQLETNEQLSDQTRIENLKFRHFAIDPLKGPLIELELPYHTKKTMNSLMQTFRPGAWIDLEIDDDVPLQGVIMEFNSAMVKLRMKKLPPQSIYSETKLVLSLPDDRYVLGK